MSMINADENFEKLGLTLPPAPAPAGVYKPCVIDGKYLYLSGHGPVRNDKSLIIGRIGKDLTMDEGKLAAQQVGLTMLATIQANLGSFNKIKRVIKVLGMVNCTLVFLLVVWFGGGKVASWQPRITALTLTWLFAFILVAYAEELLNRGFIMAVLRRCRNHVFVLIFLPSVIFGAIHLGNPSVTLLSVFNIIIVGILFSYMFIKSGNIWMCIGYHFTWNVFQGIIYGMPVSGLNIPGIITTHFTRDNILNGGGFGIEGGILTTLVTLLSFLFVRYYYRNSTYDFMNNTD